MVIPIEQLKCIGNIDETCLSLNGSDNVRGGRHEVILYNPRIHQVGKATSKSSLTSTMITGSNAAGEAIVPHFQYQLKVKSKDKMRLQYDMAEYMPHVVGQFRWGKEQSWPVTFGQNEKGGMDEVEFEEYLFNSIVPLYLAKNMPGHRGLLKVDSGLSWMNIRLLSKLQTFGFMLYPGVPNMTHVIQETDQCSGSFKTQFTIKVDNLLDARLKKEKSVSLQPKLVRLPVFGGLDSKSEFNIEVAAFQQGFNRDMCVSAWEKVGAATKDGIT